MCELVILSKKPTKQQGLCIVYNIVCVGVHHFCDGDSPWDWYSALIRSVFLTLHLFKQVVPLCHCCDISWSYSFMWVRENNFIVYFTFYHRMHLDVLCTYCRWHIIYYNIFSYLWNPVTGACSQNIAHSFILNPIKIQTCTFNVFILFSWKRRRLKCEGFNQFKSCV